jgi:magnesium-transporting ATPase (P-type)
VQQWYGNPWIYVVKSLDTDIYSGLKDEKIIKLRKEYGENIISVSKGKGIKYLIINNICQVYIFILLILIGIFIMNKEYILAAIIMLIAVSMIFFMSFIDSSEQRALKHFDKLNKIKTRCIRNGHINLLDCKELVIGDIILLQKGDVVPADLRIIESNDLKVIEGAITGESYQVDKYETKVEGEVDNITQMKNILFKSSYVIEGECTAVVVATGMNTQIGNLISDIKAKDNNKYITGNIRKVLNYLQVYGLIASSILLISGILLDKDIQNILKMIKMIFTVTSLNGILVICVLFVLILKRKMNDGNITLRKLSSINKIAEIKLIILNKIGFLSENTMVVREVFSDGNLIDSTAVKAVKDYNLERIIHIGVLCNNGGISNTSNPTMMNMIDKAILKFAKDNSIDKLILEESQPSIFEILYDNERKFMTTVNKVEDNYRINVRGSLEQILQKSVHIMRKGIEVEITAADIEAVRQQAIKMSSRGYQVVAFAYRNFNYEPSPKENIESHLVFVGIMGVENPLRTDVQNNLTKLSKLNIKPIIVTEDDKLIAVACGKQLDIISNVNEVLSEVELNNINKEDYLKIIGNFKIYSKLKSEDKRFITNSLKKSYGATAFCCSSFSDTSALNVADIGISIGENASNTVKEISDVNIKDNYFDYFIALVEKCRNYIINIRNAIKLVFTCLFCEVFCLLVAFCLNYTINISFYDIIFINIITLTITTLSVLSSENTKYVYNDEFNKVIDRKIAFRCCFTALINGLFIVCCIWITHMLGISNKYFIEIFLIFFSQFIMKVKFSRNGFKIKHKANLWYITNIFLMLAYILAVINIK